MTTDPYATLGVARDASQDDIRKAYRRKAQRAHPDRKGGDAERFRAIQEAYDILSDPARRSRYDETGDTGRPRDTDADALNYAASVLRTTIDGMHNVETTDLVSLMGARVKQDMDNQRHNKIQAEAVLSKRSKVMERLSDGPLKTMISQDIASLNDTIKTIESNILTMTRAGEIIEGYTYRTDIQEAWHRFPTEEDIQKALLDAIRAM